MRILLSDASGGSGDQARMRALKARLAEMGHELASGDWDVEVAWIGEGREVVVEEGHTTPVVACGEWRSAEAAKQAVEAGADDYIAHDSETAEWEIRLQAAQARRRGGARRGGGVSHDFNNLLAAIRGNAELALLQAGLPEAVRMGLERILEAADRAHELASRLDGVEPARRRRGVVMVADGRREERAAAAAALGRAGFVVFEAGTGEEALEVSRQAGLALEAVVLDLGLAGGEAGRLLREMRARRPGLRVVAWGEAGQGDPEMMLIERAPLAEDLPLLVEHALGA